MNLKELFKSNWPRAWLIILLYIIYAIAGTLSEYLFKYALNAIIKGNLSGYIYWQIMQAVAELVTALLLPWATIIFTKQTQNYLHQIRNEMMHHYYAKNDEKVSSMQNELSNNLKMLTTDYATPWVSILSGILEIVLSIAVLISLNWILLIFTAVMTVVVMLLPHIMAKRTSKASAAVAQENDRLLNAIEHWLGGLQELRRYNAFVRLHRELDQASGNYAEKSIKAAKYHGIAYLINGFGNGLAQVGMGLFAGLLFLGHVISFGDFAVASSFAFTIFSAMWEITSAISQIKSTQQLRTDTFKLRKQLASGLQNRVPAYGVKVQNLTVQYQRGEEIKYPDFTIKKGEKVLLVGDSGTGKSTLFKLLLGKLKPKTGQITFLDKNNQPLATSNVKIGYLPQDPKVFPVTIRDNITMFNEKLANLVNYVVEKVQLQPDLAKMPAGLNTEVNLKKENLSGGQRQKVVLARSEIHQQSFVLMDEATSAIDAKATAKIIANLLENKQTILLIAHNFSPKLSQKFDQIIRLKGKKVQKK